MSVIQEMENMHLNNSISIPMRRIEQHSNLSQIDPVFAVRVENACKAYNKENPVLNGLNISVEKGSIYGLLGASGCGKTTILSCIIGQKKLDEGRITVFGKVPGSKGSGIPGTTIGFMPQEIALYQVLTIGEVFKYFGKIYGMSTTDIRNKLDFLLKFLDLPEPTSLISSLSGGQQRRVSLAVTLISQPPILILDEPTVGVDALLRESIWQHLNQIVRDFKTTIIITTHYIEEANHCRKVGIMRNGKLLAEDSPKFLLNHYKTNSLEEVFLKLCHEDSQNINNNECSPIVKRALRRTSASNIVPLAFNQRRDSSLDIFNNSNSNNNKNIKENLFYNAKDSLSHNFGIISTLVIKNFLTMHRFPVFAVISLTIPLLFTILSCVIVGAAPKLTRIGVVDNELLEIVDNDFYETCKQFKPNHNCFDNKISCQFFDVVSKEDFVLIPYRSEGEALQSVQRGDSLGFIVIPENYTEHMADRAVFGKYAENETLDGSSINGRFDMSFQLKTQIVISNLLLNFQTFLRGLVKSCNGTRGTAEVAFKLSPVYGQESMQTGFSEFLQPGLLLAIMFLMPLASGMAFIQDKKAGTLQRSIVAGVKLPHILISIIITEGCLTIIQLGLSFGCMKFVFGFQVLGSITLFLTICFFQAVTSLSFAFAIGVACDHEMEAVYSGLAVWLSLLSSSGITWPLHGLPKWAFVICQLLPTTIPINALRSVSSRGWGFTHNQVWPAFGVFASWITIMCIFSTFIYMKKQK